MLFYLFCCLVFRQVRRPLTAGCVEWKKKTSTQEAVTESGTFQATVVCLGCTLKKEQGAKAQCSVYGHKNALKTADGKIWSILENDASTELLNNHEYAGKRVEIAGKKIPEAQVIQVDSFKVIE